MIHSNYELKDTVDLMNSSNYKTRFLAEYLQTKLRYEKLHSLVTKAEAGKLGFKLNCPLDLLIKQKSFMGQYLHMLEIRAEIEDISLDYSPTVVTIDTQLNKALKDFRDCGRNLNVFPLPPLPPLSTKRGLE